MPKLIEAGILFTRLGQDIKNDKCKIQEINSDNFVPVVTYGTYETRLISKKIEVQNNVMPNDKSEFDIELSFTNKSDIKKGKEHFSVPHKALAYEFSDPKIPPSATAQLYKDSFQRIAVTLTQNDPYSESVRVYYRYVDPPASGNKGNFYKYHTRVSLKPGETYSGTFNIKTRGKNLILRFISVSMLGRSGAFVDVVVNQTEKNKILRNHGVGHPITRPYVKGTLIHDTQGGGIRLRWLNGGFSPGCDIIAIKEKYRKSELGVPTLIDREHLLLDTTAANHEFFDTDVQPGYFYQYTLSGITDGRTFTGTDLRTLVDYQEFPSWIKVGIKKVHGGNSEDGDRSVSNNLVNTFKLIANTRQTETELLLEFLNDVGLASAYIDDLDDIKEKLHLFTVYKITRKDCDTGQVVDLGYHRPGKFTDTLRRKSNLSVQSAYVFELFVGNPPDIINALKLGSNLNMPPELQTTQKDLEKDVKKDNPDYASREVFTQSTVTNARNSGLNLLKTGFVYTHLIRKSPGSESNEILRLKARRLESGANLVTWAMGNGYKSIDHFVIYSVINGRKSIAGVHSHVPSGGKCKFYDLRCRGAIGTVYYQVCPVSLGFALSKVDNRTNLIQMV